MVGGHEEELCDEEDNSNLKTKMAVSLLSATPVPKLSTIPNCSARTSNGVVSFIVSSRRRSSSRLRAGLSEIEPDLNEDPVDRWETNSVSPEDFLYGKYDGHHTYFEGDVKKGTFWGALADEVAMIEPPMGFQGLISWAFLPAVALSMYLKVPGDYLFLGAALFTVVFCIIEMDKPDQPHNFEPEIYNMERGSRDKVIADYNTMDIWDFNEKYGDLWDFTLKQDDIMKRL